MREWEELEACWKGGTTCLHSLSIKSVVGSNYFVFIKPVSTVQRRISPFHTNVVNYKFIPRTPNPSMTPRVGRGFAAFPAAVDDLVEGGPVRGSPVPTGMTGPEVEVGWFSPEPGAGLSEGL